MRVGSLFSGIGGLDLGLERAGMEVVWQVEVDDWCRRILERHWPDVARFRDVRDCHGEALAQPDSGRGGSSHRDVVHEGRPTSEGGGEGIPQATRRAVGTTESDDRPASTLLAPVDLICGGFPCQPVSHAGQRKGESDSRWLWPEFYRIVCEAQPRWVLVENVPGLRSIDGGRLFGGILRDLAEAGYDAVWFGLSAADVGAPHLRERVFIVADAEGITGEVRQAQAQRQGRPPGGGEVAYAGGAGLALRSEPTDGRGTIRDEGTPVTEGGWWAVEPDVGRVAHGIPSRVDRLRGLGNAVIPQVAEVIGRWIMEAR